MEDPTLARLGDMAALLRASRTSQRPDGDAILRKRQMVADFCKLLGGEKIASSHASLVASIRPPLSPRQSQTLELLLAGDSEKQLARKLAISPHTAHIHVKTIYKRLGVSSRGELLSRFVGS
jgi:DNA-binding CsgD family transcriptional regulator